MVTILTRAEKLKTSCIVASCASNYRLSLKTSVPKMFIRQWRSDGGAGRAGRHLLGAAKGRKTEGEGLPPTPFWNPKCATGWVLGCVPFELRLCWC